MRLHDRFRIFRLIFPTLVLLSFLTCQPSISADQPKLPEEKALELQNLYSNLTSLTFDFEQITRTGGRERTGRGDAVFYKTDGSFPDAGSGPAIKTKSVMRWNYSEPDSQTIINDGDTLSIYTASDHQLIKTPAREIESDITYAFFAGTRDLLDDFAARTPDNGLVYATGENLETLLLVPRKPHNQIRDVQIWFTEDNIIRHMAIHDHFDSVTELDFDHIKRNSLPPGDPAEIKKITTLKVAPGTEIITR